MHFVAVPYPDDIGQPYWEVKTPKTKKKHPLTDGKTQLLSYRTELPPLRWVTHFVVGSTEAQEQHSPLRHEDEREEVLTVPHKTRRGKRRMMAGAEC